MGDDEFFSEASSATGGTAIRNPLSLDELAALSRQLMNIAFPLYWYTDHPVVKDGTAPNLRLTWLSIREKATRCLQLIHARDSRRRFTPEGHWLVTSDFDVRAFAGTAVADEQELNRVDSTSRVLSKRQMAFISPRLGVLNNIPFAIPFPTRVQIFRNFVANDKDYLGIDDLHALVGHRAVVRRGHIAEDGFDHLGSLGRSLKGRVHITFIDEWGNEEAGIDGGGVFKEFLTSLAKEAFDTNRGLWLSNAQREFYPNPHSYAKEPHQLNWFRFMGRVLGKALYEGILVDVAFAPFFLAKWLGRNSYLDDLASLDPALYQGLVFLKHYPGNPEDLSLNFAVTDDEFGVVKTIDLIPNGSNIPVTRENRTKYIYLASHYRLNTQMKPQSDAFFSGLSDIIDPKWLRMFNQQELQILIGGVEEPIDVDDLQNNTIYGGLYDNDHPVIQAFWRAVRSFDQNSRRALIRFVTSCSRPPLLGFGELVPKFSIRDAGEDDNRLPTASTCVNLLKVIVNPQYS
jgi:ubiquitin-protein ligase E3 C